MILGYDGDYYLFEIESYCYRIIKINIYNRNKFCSHEFFNNSSVGIAPRC